MATIECELEVSQSTEVLDVELQVHTNDGVRMEQPLPKAVTVVAAVQFKDHGVPRR